MKKLLILYQLCISIFLFSQSGRIDLNQALDLGAKYPSIQLRESAKAAQGHIIDARKAEYIPNVFLQEEINLGTSNSVTGALFPLENPFPTVAGGIKANSSAQPIWGNLSVLQVNWDIYNFGKTKSAIDEAKAEYTLRSKELDNEVFQHKVKIIDTYLKILAYQKLLDIGNEEVKKWNELKSIIDARVNSGLRPGVDSTFANANIATAKINVLKTEEELDAEKLKLKMQTLYPQTSIQIDSMKFYTKIPQLMDNATINEENNPQLGIFTAQKNIEIAKDNELKRSYYPNIMLNGAVWGRGSGVDNKNLVYNSGIADGLKYQVADYILGLGVSWNLTSFYKIRNQRLAQKEYIQESQSKYDEEKLRLQNEIEESQARLSSLAKQLHEVPLQVQSAQANYNQILARYNSGLSTIVDLVDAYNILYKAMNDQSIMINNAWRYLLMYCAGKGDLTPFINQMN